MTVWMCPDCGYRYDSAIGDPDGGIPYGIPFEELPYDWCCPVCGTGKDEFVKMLLVVSNGVHRWMIADR